MNNDTVIKYKKIREYNKIKKYYQIRRYNLVELDFTRLKDEEDIFMSFSSQLKFPKYFGYNWDALNDLLRNLDWLPSKDTVILINNINLLKDKIYFNELLEILIHSHNIWRLENRNFISIILLTHNNKDIIQKIKRIEKKIEILIKNIPDYYGGGYVNVWDELYGAK